MKLKTILITGASGFVGSYALPFFEDKFNVQKVSLRTTPIDEISFTEISTVVHLAGKAHQMKRINPEEYFKVNHKLTLRLAKRAKKENVKHFIFISSVKVYGDNINTYFDEDSECFPTEPYGKSKLLAEKDLLSLNDENFIISIIRPPLIYGPNVKGNLKKIRALIERLPILPLGAIQNERSMVFVGNLTALIIHIIELKPKGIFIAGDNSRKSTTELIEIMMKHMRVDKLNIALPFIFRHILKILKPSIYTRLFESYIINNHKTNKRLAFMPPYSFEEGIKSMVSRTNK